MFEFLEWSDQHRISSGFAGPVYYFIDWDNGNSNFENVVDSTDERIVYVRAF